MTGQLDWKKIFAWTLIFLVGAAFWILLAWKLMSCNGCSSGDEEIIYNAKRDSTLEKQITIYKLQVDSLNASIDSLVKCFDEIEQSRHENIITIKTKNAIAEIQSSDLLYKQARQWLSGSRPLNLKRYEFDSLDVLRIIKKKNENEYLTNDNKLLGDEAVNLNSQITNYKWQISDLTKINQLKDEQLQKLENIPRTTINVNKRKWYTDAMIITGSVAFGFTAGIIYKNFKK
jgi:hypothetical protein